LVQRGAPLEIVTNLHAKRKTEQMILFDAGTRLYGADAESLYGRKPHVTPSAMTVMLGRDEAHPAVQVLVERHYPHVPTYNDTRAGTYISVAKHQYTPEELISMVLEHAKDITKAYGEEKGASLGTIKDVVLTVPCFATQHERLALLDAASLANLNVLALIDETTAAALQYGMDKVEEMPQIIIFYNLGAFSLQVSIVKFLSYKHKDSKYAKEKTVGGFEVLAKAWDSTFGGQAVDQVIVDHLANEFNAKLNHAGSTANVRDDSRAMAKLRLQANKIKHVLSANSEIPIYIDGLYQDTALSSHMTRIQLELLCHDMMKRAVTPIQTALTMANLTAKDIHGIELIGGGMRVPKVQEEISKLLHVELGLHINSDESMALGAAFHGANISTAFKVRHVGMADINPFPVAIALLNMVEDDGSSEPWSKKATLFKANGKVGVKKTIAFTHDQDVHCALDYEDVEILPQGTELSLVRYNITGIAAFAAEMQEKGLGKPKVSLQFELSNSGITQLVKAEAAVEETYMGEQVIEVDDDDDDSNKTTTEEALNTTTEEAKDSVDETTNETKTESTGDEKEGAKDDQKKKKEKKEKPKPKPKKKITVEKIFGLRKPLSPAFVSKERKRTHRKALIVESYHVGRIQPYSPELMAESKAKMEELARKDKERQMLDEARNNLESYIYLIKNKLSDDEEAIGKVSTQEQRDECQKLADAAEEWMSDDGYDADHATMVAKFVELSTPFEKIRFRQAEAITRPVAMDALTKKLTQIEEMMTVWESSMPQVTEVERNEVLAKVELVKAWMKEQQEAQEKVAPSEEPAFKSEDVPLQTKGIESILARLIRKPKPKLPKKNETKADNETKAENETVTLDPKDGEEILEVVEEVKNATEATEKSGVETSEETKTEATEEKKTVDEL